MVNKKKFIKVEMAIIKEEVMALGSYETLKGKTIKLDLSRKLRGRNLEIIFALRNVEEKVVGYPKKIGLMKQYILRMMRKRANYVEDSFEAECKDIVCTMKPFLITRKKVPRSIRQNLRKTAKEFLTDFAKDRNYIELCEGVIYGEVQKEMLTKLKKIYPLSFCEIRVLETKKLNDADLKISEKEIQKEVREEFKIEGETEEEIAEERPNKPNKKKNSEGEE